MLQIDFLAFNQRNVTLLFFDNIVRYANQIFGGNRSGPDIGSLFFNERAILNKTDSVVA